MIYTTNEEERKDVTIDFSFLAKDITESDSEEKDKRSSPLSFHIHVKENLRNPHCISIDIIRSIDHRQQMFLKQRKTKSTIKKTNLFVVVHE